MKHQMPWIGHFVPYNFIANKLYNLNKKIRWELKIFNSYNKQDILIYFYSIIIVIIQIPTIIAQMVKLFAKLLALILLVSCSACHQQCIAYLMQLQKTMLDNRTKFIAQMMPYLVLSGKSIDDLGFPGSCLKDKNNYKYSTVEVTIQTNTTQYTGYLGFCFIGMCPVEDLNGFAEFIIDFIFAQYEYGVSGKFIESPLELQFSLSALIICLGFVVLIAITMVVPIRKWIEMCRQPQDSQYSIKSVYIDLQNPDNQLDQQRITPYSTTMEKASIKYKWTQLWKEQETFKIYSFSLFRVLALPMILYGQIFWLTNFGAFNYYAFYEEIYDQFYVKFAIFSYYLPDVFFFIISYNKQQGQPYKHLFKAIGHKLARLYPLYIVVFIIYWGVSPALHCGPIWYVYQKQAQICSTTWWRVLLLIDNWFTQGCYPALWFVQAQMQYTLVVSLFFFVVYLKKPKTASFLLAFYLIVTFVLLFVFSAEMLVSVQIAIDPYTQLYFKSFHSHIWFYLVGVLFGLIAQKQKVRFAVQQVILDKKVLRRFLNIFAWGMLVLILFRPWVWWGHKSLKVELVLCRYGALLCFILLFLRGMFVRQTNTSVLHKYGYYMYPVALVSYMVAQSSFWSVGSFMYVSGNDILNQMIPNFIISYALGIFLGLLFDIRTFKIK